MVKNPLASARDIRDVGLIPGSGRSLEEEMVTHSSILAWRIPWTEEPGDRVAKSRTGLKRLSTHRIKSALPLPPQLVPWWDQNHSGVACATL